MLCCLAICIREEIPVGGEFLFSEATLNTLYAGPFMAMIFVVTAHASPMCSINTASDHTRDLSSGFSIDDDPKMTTAQRCGLSSPKETPPRVSSRVLL